MSTSGVVVNTCSNTPDGETKDLEVLVSLELSLVDSGNEAEEAEGYRLDLPEGQGKIRRKEIDVSLVQISHDESESPYNR